MLGSPLRSFATLGRPVVKPSPAPGRASVLSLMCDGVEMDFFGVWLRDHCPQELDPTTQQRQVDTVALPLDITPYDVSVSSGGDLRVVWPGDPPHVSFYDSDWLARHGLPAGGDAAAGKHDPATDSSSRVLFGADTFEGGGLPTVHHDDVMASDDALFDALCMLRDYGFVMVDGTEVSEAATKAITERIGFIRPTLYSPDMWMTEVLPDGNDTAYTSNPLAAHTDGCYWDDKPGIQVFHCLQEATEGGDTLLVDGFNVIHQLSQRYPDAYDFFTSTLLPFHHTDPDNDLRTWKPVIKLDAAGNVTEFSYNNEDRAVTDLPRHAVEPFYRHLGELMSIVRDPANELWIKLRPGTTIFIHNIRVMHGRSAFSSVSGRKLSGCYVNQEDFASRLRSLATKRGVGVHRAESVG